MDYYYEDVPGDHGGDDAKTEAEMTESRYDADGEFLCEGAGDHRACDFGY